MAHRRIVIKVGSQLLTGSSRDVPAYLTALFRMLGSLRQAGWQVALVLSGAVANGEFEKLTSAQARAAVGQLRLAHHVVEAATSAGESAALVLISREDIVNRARYDTLGATFEELLNAGVVPVINENDVTASATHHDFADNDQLATIVAVMLSAEHLFLLTNVDGVLDDVNGSGSVIPEIANINQEIMKRLAVGKSIAGRGGMAGKLRAARIATAAGIPTTIMRGEQPDAVRACLVDGVRVGTRCLSRSGGEVSLSLRERWLLSAPNTGASIQIDRGATSAVHARKSLLAVGVTKVYGRFAERECVEIVDEHGDTVALGLAVLSSHRLEKLLQQADRPYNVEVVHADNLRPIV